MKKLDIEFRCSNRTVGYLRCEAERLPPVGTTVTTEEGVEHRTTSVCHVTGGRGVIETERLGPMSQTRVEFRNMVGETVGFRSFDADKVPATGDVTEVGGKRLRVVTSQSVFSGLPAGTAILIATPDALTAAEKVDAIREEFRLGERRQTPDEIAADKAAAEKIKREIGL